MAESRMARFGMVGVQVPHAETHERIEVQYQAHDDDGVWWTQNDGEDFRALDDALAYIDAAAGQRAGRPHRIVRVTAAYFYELLDPATPPRPHQVPMISKLLLDADGAEHVIAYSCDALRTIVTACCSCRLFSVSAPYGSPRARAAANARIQDHVARAAAGHG